MSPNKFANRGTVQILDNAEDEYEDVENLLRTSRGQSHARPSHNTDHRRSNRFTQDGYGDSDFA